MNSIPERRSGVPLALAAGLALACAAALLLLAPRAAADAPNSASYELSGYTLSGGGAVSLKNTGSGATATADVTIGQGQPITEMRGPTSGLTLQPGFWNALSVPEPSLPALGLGAMAALTALARARRRS